MNSFDFRWNYLGALAAVIAENLKSNHTHAFEWGGGYSTFVLASLIASRRLERLTSVEHSPNYFSILRRYIPDLEGISLLNLELFEKVNISRVEQDDNIYYSSAPQIEKSKMSFFIIDGRSRAECLLNAAYSSAKDSLFVLDDWERARYRPALRLFESTNKYLRFLTLKLRPEVWEYLHDSYVRPEAYELSLSTAEHIGGMAFIPHAPQLTNDEMDELKFIFKGVGMSSKDQIIGWGPLNMTRCFERVACYGTDRVKQITTEDDSGFSIEGSGNFELIKLTLTGSLNDLSKDPNPHYSSWPYDQKRPYVMMVVAGLRRPECVLTAALSLRPGGFLVLRKPNSLHLSASLCFFERHEELENWTVFKLKKEVPPILDANIQS